MTKEGAFRLADKVTWRDWTDGGEFSCPCGAHVPCGSSREAGRTAYKGHLLRCH